MRTIGRYEVVKELGEGQYGTVYQAVGQVPGRGRQPGRRRVVAIKALKNTSDAESAAGLVQEFALLDQVKHRSIVRVFEYIEEERAVVMEYVHGATLRDVLDTLSKQRDQVFTEAAVEIACEVADALFQAFTTPGDNGEPLQLVHRDLKPVNIMLTPTGEVKVLDWGLAKVDNAEYRPDDADQIKGTLLYMSPEQARGEPVDHRSDLFSLGLMLFEVLMREPLYQVDERAADPLAKVMADIERGDTQARCAELEASLPRVGAAISRLLHTRPGDRYENGQELLVDLRRTLHRPRGVDLQEFCEYFFGQYMAIGDPPDPDKLGNRAQKPSRMSIEERLRRSMARQAKAAGSAPRQLGPRTPPAAGSPSPPPAAPRSVPRAPRAKSAAPPPPPPAATTSPSRRPPPPKAPKRTPRPPVGGGATRASPFAPPSAPPRKRRRDVGERAPDETGMLQMVPLSQDEDEDEVSGDPSATAFFALPPPKANRTPQAPPAPPSMGAGAPPPAPGGFGGPPPAPGGMGAPPPPPRPGFAAGQPPPVASPMGGGGPPPPAIRGPVAGGPTAQAASPFQVQQQAAPPPANDAGRVKNYTVYAIVLGLVTLVCTAVLLAVFLAPDKSGDPDPVVADAGKGGLDLGNTPPAPERKRKVVDSGDPPEPKPKPKTRTRKRSSGSGGSAPASKPKPKPAPSGGTLTVKLTDPSVSTWILVTCNSGFSARGTFNGGTAKVANVPPDSCTINFKGGSPAKHHGVRGGQTVTCSPQGTIGNCR